eukprot:883812-Amphidinium_carterae.1
MTYLRHNENEIHRKQQKNTCRDRTYLVASWLQTTVICGRGDAAFSQDSKNRVKCSVAPAKNATVKFTCKHWTLDTLAINFNILTLKTRRNKKQHDI